jgi:glycyl-tRNA synthetase beta chain
MGGIYAREEGLPEPVWKAIYFHYLPVGVEADAPPTKTQLGHAAVTWAAVSLADKLDTLVGLFAAGEKPTGSRDPYGLRRAAQGIVKTLVDLPSLGVRNADRIDLATLIDKARELHTEISADGAGDWRSQLWEFCWERESHLFERRGFKSDEIRVVGGLRATRLMPLAAMHRVEATAKARGSKEFQDLAFVFKRVKNITKDREDRGVDLAALLPVLREPSETALANEMIQRWPEIDEALRTGHLVDAMHKLAKFHKPVDKFFQDVLVMAEDRDLREARLDLLTRLRNAILTNVGDISEIAAEEVKQA